MGRHHWAQPQDPADGPEPTGRFRLLLGRGALFCVVLAVLCWIAVSLLLGPRGRDVEPLAEVPLTGIERLPATPGPSPEPAGEGPRDPAAPPVPAAPTASSTAPAATPGELVVHVAGAVRKPGIYRLPAGARAYEAIEAAGGLLKDADASALNLAAVAHDATQLYVPRKDEVPGVRPPGAAAPPEARGLAIPGTVPGTRLDINTADAAALQTLPGIGPALAGKIIAFRTANGPFTSLAELDAVSGIGPVMLERLEPLVDFP